jgi:hypothetical protein
VKFDKTPRPRICFPLAPARTEKSSRAVEV